MAGGFGICKSPHSGSDNGIFAPESSYFPAQKSEPFVD